MERVTVSCPHCNSNTDYAVLDKDAIRGVPATYEKTAELQHEVSAHPGRMSERSSAIWNGRPDPTGEPIVGRIKDFNHGKDHNA